MATYSSNTTIKYNSAVNNLLATTIGGTTSYTVPANNYGDFLILAVGGTLPTVTINGVPFGLFGSGDFALSQNMRLGVLPAGTVIALLGSNVQARLVGTLFTNTP